MAATQNLKSHTRWDPLFHFFILPALLLNIIFSIIYTVRHYGGHAHSGPWLIVMSFVLFVLAGKTRSYALKVQDRVIRLEERYRLAQFASASEIVELESLTTEQYVALRFASNAELPELARRAVREKLDGKQIKQAIVSWRADNHRV